MKPPNIGHFKLNSDGSCLGNPHQGGINGVIRDSRGGWVVGYSKSFPIATNNQMELLTLIESIKIAEKKSLVPLKLTLTPEKSSEYSRKAIYIILLYVMIVG